MLRLLSVKRAVVVLAGLAVAAGGGLAVAAAVGSGAPDDKAAALARHVSVAITDSNTEQVAPPEWALRPIPARMLSPGVPVPVAPSVLHLRNGWLVSDGKTLLAVYAGAAGDDPSAGRLVIVRQDLVAGKQTVSTLDAGPTGALAITAAPLGSSVETSAQTGSILLQTAEGRPLRLDLGTGTLGSG
jgi:hypothetical protein